MLGEATQCEWTFEHGCRTPTCERAGSKQTEHGITGLFFDMCESTEEGEKDDYWCGY